VILFQEDIRRVLSRMGKKTVFPSQDQLSSRQVLDEISRAATGLAAKTIGALIIIERNIILSRYVDIGILIDAKISKELLLSVFHPTSPIHDGAVIIQQGRIAAAGCFLPLTRDEEVDPNFGTRHRAAIGISQETDAIAIAVSEENGTVSLMVDGKTMKNLDTKELRKALRRLLSAPSDEPQEAPPRDRPGQWLDRLRSFFQRGSS
jgi:diadenylate cyclase